MSTIWLNPIYPSPRQDGGYDVTGYYDVDPRLGSLGDFAELLDQADELGMRIILDLVVARGRAGGPLERRCVPRRRARDLDLQRAGRTLVPAPLLAPGRGRLPHRRGAVPAGAPVGQRRRRPLRLPVPVRAAGGRASAAQPGRGRRLRPGRGPELLVAQRLRIPLAATPGLTSQAAASGGSACPGP
ncbi:alpha-amylase family glycosyl hydrolase [Crossiella sp. SN42]|uniref:alpha-amylase family glycosyl hydrolase n=1 Tax=Crossiella sp. SN42 TaxID=2944808 RepID=UPI00207C373D|nr:alpha-amylase family glycosyl hydrolase [Crossiella sp. SN42]MCO1581487.1 alpha-amylase family glycosyl hydrolase [Crossiella sp. SN42]